MKRVCILILILTACQPKDVNFKYKEIQPSMVLIENYTPVTREALTKYLIKVNDSLRLDSLNFCLVGENLQMINPRFKKIYYRGYIGRMDLDKHKNDTLKAMRNMNFCFGTLKGGEIMLNHDWDSVLLDKRFFKNETE